jgi:hypothetical protein
MASVMGLVGSAQMSEPMNRFVLLELQTHIIMLLADYSASKAALISLHESLRYELDNRYLSHPLHGVMSTQLPLILSYLTPKIRTSLVVAGHVLTPLFSRVTLPTNAFYKFFVPSLPPVALVKAVITALDEQHSKTIYLPFYTHFAGWLGLVPSFVRDPAQWVSEYSL